MLRDTGSRLLILIALFFALFTLSPFWVLTGIDYSIFNIHRIAEICLISGALLTLLLSRRLQHQWTDVFGSLPELGRLGIILFFGMGVASTLSSKLPRYAFLETGLFALLFFLTLIIATEVNHRKESITSKLIAILFFAIATYSVIFHVNVLFPFSNNTFSPGLSNVRQLAQLQAWTLPLVSLPLFFGSKLNTVYRYLIHLAAGLWWSIAFFNSAKGLAISLIVSGLLLALLLSGKQFRLWISIQGKVLLLGLGFYLCFSLISNESSYLTHIGDSVNVRAILWHEAFAYIIDSPILGVGPIHYANHYNGLGAHPHNSLLQIAAEWGLPAALIMLSLFFWGFVSWIRKCMTSATPIEIALTYSLLCGAIYSLVSGTIVMPISQVTMCLVVGLMLGMHQKCSVNARLSQPKNKPQWLLVAAVLLILIRFTSVLFPEVLHLSRDEFVWIVTHSENGHTTLHPRFWQQGWISRP